jgi:hypothetical protein
MTTALEIFWEQIDIARQTGDDADLIFNRYVQKFPISLVLRGR